MTSAHELRSFYKKRNPATAAARPAGAALATRGAAPGVAVGVFEVDAAPDDDNEPVVVVEPAADEGDDD